MWCCRSWASWVDDSLAAKGRTYDNKDRIAWQEKVIPLNQTKGLDLYDNLVAVIYGKERLRVSLEDVREQIRLIAEAKKISGFYNEKGQKCS